MARQAQYLISDGLLDDVHALMPPPGPGYVTGTTITSGWGFRPWIVILIDGLLACSTALFARSQRQSESWSHFVNLLFQVCLAEIVWPRDDHLQPGGAEESLCVVCGGITRLSLSTEL
jgi:hypothetical protein